MLQPVQPSWKVRAAAGDAPATIRVSRLQSSISGPSDAWGRTGRPQPVLISAEVVLNRPFGSSSSADAVESDTVHYGLLSKRILSTLSALDHRSPSVPWRLEDVLTCIWKDLTGLTLHETRPDMPVSEPFLHVSLLRLLCITVHLPKASLLGAGLSYMGVAAFDGRNTSWPTELSGVRLTMHDIKVPTLIGVNDNERQAKQVVIASLEIEEFTDPTQQHHLLESLVVRVRMSRPITREPSALARRTLAKNKGQTMSESAFETLEALAAELTVRVAQHMHGTHTPVVEHGWDVKVILEKPVAVPFAEAACVELKARTADVLDAP